MTFIVQTEKGEQTMSRDKQIEEMAKICTAKCHKCHNDECRRGTKSQYCICETLYNAGYRKASDVLDEINNSLIKPDFNSNEIAIGFDWAITDVRKLLLKLKKKYESEGADGET